MASAIVLGPVADANSCARQHRIEKEIRHPIRQNQVPYLLLAAQAVADCSFSRAPGPGSQGQPAKVAGIRLVTLGKGG